MGNKPVKNHTKTVVERETGIEPASLAWKARVLPLNYSRIRFTYKPDADIQYHLNEALQLLFSLVERAGFEPAYS